MSQTREKKPDWVKIRLDVNNNYKSVRSNLQSLRLHTVCEEARCPNVHECWGRGTATFMILGDTCTRSCRFCAVHTGKPLVYDKGEPLRVAKSVRQMKLNHVVITSVNRDELADGGSGIWAETIGKIRELNPETSIEVLTPDFKGIWDQLKTVLDARPDIFSHNLETVPDLYKNVRPQAKYERSLLVLENAKKYGAITKTGIMLGLGESKEQVIELMKNCVQAGVDILNIGQYLQPSKKHLQVKRYVHPTEFSELKKTGTELGLSHVEAGPLVRSSFHAEDQLKKLRELRKSFAAV